MDVRKRVSYSLFQMNTKCNVMLNVNAHFFGVYIVLSYLSVQVAA